MTIQNYPEYLKCKVTKEFEDDLDERFGGKVRAFLGNYDKYSNTFVLNKKGKDILAEIEWLSLEEKWFNTRDLTIKFFEVKDYGDYGTCLIIL